MLLRNKNNMTNNIPKPKNDDISRQVAFSPVIVEIWFNVLSAIALNVRLQQGGALSKMVIISQEETAYLSENGGMLLACDVNSEQVMMAVPAQFWRWTEGEKHEKM